MSPSEKQLMYFKVLSEACNETVMVVNGSYSYKYYRVPYYQFTGYHRGRTTIGRYRLQNEITWDFDNKGKHFGRENIVIGWGELVPQVTSLVKVLKEMVSPHVVFDSGTGFHVTLFTDNVIGRAKAENIEPYKLIKAVWKAISKRAGIELVEDDSVMGRSDHSTIKAVGGWNKNSNSYKTLLSDVSPNKQFTELRDVIYPDNVEFFTVPDEILDNAVKGVKAVKKIRTPQSFKLYSGKRMELPCMVNLLTKPIPPTGKGTRNTLAFLVAYNAYLDFRGDKKKVDGFTDLYEENCMKLDYRFPRGSQRNWYKLIERKGIKSCFASCKMVWHYENVLRKQGTPIALCDKRRCRVHRERGVRRIMRLIP
jgi:hypothetical protein